jgi:hypothetical protein
MPYSNKTIRKKIADHLQSKLISTAPAQTLQLNLRGTVSKFATAATTPGTTEVACFGTRGDGKTIGALIAMIMHALKHDDAGYPLPTSWMGVTDTFQSHTEKTIFSLENPLWRGLWKVTKGGHLATATLNGKQLVKLSLFGIEDEGAKARVRREAHGAWWEEPAPASVLVESSGVDEDSYAMGITSLRMASYHNPCILTLNYPDEDHWTWRRFVEDKHSGTAYFRVPPGERATPEQRKLWLDATANRPDLQRRLLLGMPGTILQGGQVAEGFNEDQHVAKERLTPIKGEALFIGQDFGHTPTVVIGQSWRGHIRVYAALTIERGGIKQLVESVVRPWIQANANGFQLCGNYDPSAADEQTDIEQNPAELLRVMLPGYWEPGPVKWDNRKGPVLAVMNKAVAGMPALQIDPTCKELIRSLSGRWYYPRQKGMVSRDLPKKPNHPWEDYGDAFAYMLCAMGVNAHADFNKPAKYTTFFDPRLPDEPGIHQMPGDVKIDPGWDPRI